MLETENATMTTQEYKQRYLYIFKMTDKTGSSNRSSPRAHGHSHRLIQPNESEVSITVILVRKKQFFTTPNSKKVSTNKCDIARQLNKCSHPNQKYLHLYSMTDIITILTANLGFSSRASVNK